MAKLRLRQTDKRCGDQKIHIGPYSRQLPSLQSLWSVLIFPSQFESATTVSPCLQDRFRVLMPLPQLFEHVPNSVHCDHEARISILTNILEKKANIERTEIFSLRGEGRVQSLGQKGFAGEMFQVISRIPNQRFREFSIQLFSATLNSRQTCLKEMR